MPEAFHCKRLYKHIIELGFDGLRQVNWWDIRNVIMVCGDLLYTKL